MKLDTRLIGISLPLLLLALPSVYGNPVKPQVDTVPANVSSVPGNVGIEPTNVGIVPANVGIVPANVSTVPANVGTVPANVSIAETLPELAGLPDELQASNCSGATVEEMAKGSEETCVHIGNIEGYVNLVMSMIPLQIYYENHSDFTDIFKNYDNDLGVAKDHAKLWRNGDSILLGIRQTFELARQFEPAFTKKYIINKERVEVIKANADEAKIINNTKDEIESLKALLVRTEAIMALMQNPGNLGHFQMVVDDMKARIEDKERALTEDFTLIKELEELIAFLDFVRKDSERIRTQALKTKEMIEKFREYLEHDKGAFTRHGRVADETLNALEEEAIRNNEALAENKRKQENLELKIEEERKQVQALFEKINHSHEQLQKMREKLLQEISDRKTLNVFRNILTTAIIAAIYFNYASDEGMTYSQPSQDTRYEILLNPLVPEALFSEYGSDEENEYSQLLKSTMAESKGEVDAIRKQIENNRAEMRFFQEQMANSISNSDNLRNELTNFITLNGDLKKMSEKVETLLTAINKAIAGVVNIQGVFEGVSKKLTEMIDFAKKAKTEAEQLNARFFIYKELSLLECNWRDAYFKVLNLDDCTKNFQIL